MRADVGVELVHGRHEVVGQRGAGDGRARRARLPRHGRARVGGRRGAEREEDGEREDEAGLERQRHHGVWHETGTELRGGGRVRWCRTRRSGLPVGIIGGESGTGLRNVESCTRGESGRADLSSLERLIFEKDCVLREERTEVSRRRRADADQRERAGPINERHEGDSGGHHRDAESTSMTGLREIASA